MKSPCRVLLVGDDVLSSILDESDTEFLVTIKHVITHDEAQIQVRDCCFDICVASIQDVFFQTLGIPFLLFDSYDKESFYRSLQERVVAPDRKPEVSVFQKEDMITFSSSLFMGQRDFLCDTYIAINEKYVFIGGKNDVIHQDGFSSDTGKEYGISIHKKNVRGFLRFQLKKMNEQSLGNSFLKKIIFFMSLYYLIMEYVHRQGLDEEFSESLWMLFVSGQKIIRDSCDISCLMEVAMQSQSRWSHSMVTAFIVAQGAHYLGWRASSVTQKLVMSACIHDLKRSLFEKEEGTSLSRDTLMIVRQFLPLLDENGFPASKGKVHPFTKLFSVAHLFAMTSASLKTSQAQVIVTYCSEVFRDKIDANYFIAIAHCLKTALPPEYENYIIPKKSIL